MTAMHAVHFDPKIWRRQLGIVNSSTVNTNLTPLESSFGHGYEQVFAKFEPQPCDIEFNLDSKCNFPLDPRGNFAAIARLIERHLCAVEQGERQLDRAGNNILHALAAHMQDISVEIANKKDEHALRFHWACPATDVAMDDLQQVAARADIRKRFADASNQRCSISESINELSTIWDSILVNAANRFNGIQQSLQSTWRAASNLAEHFSNAEADTSAWITQVSSVVRSIGISGLQVPTDSTPQPTRLASTDDVLGFVTAAASVSTKSSRRRPYDGRARARKEHANHTAIARATLVLEQVLQSVEEFSTSCKAETEKVCGSLHAELERTVTKTMEAVAVPRHDTGSGAAHAHSLAAETFEAAQCAEAQKVQLLQQTTQAELARLEAALADVRTTVGHRTGRLQTTLVEVLRLWPITPSEARSLLSIIDPLRESMESAGDMGIDPADRERLLGVSRQTLIDVLSSAKFKHAIEAIFKLPPLQELEHAIPITHAAISAVRRAGLLVEVARASQSERAQRQQAANELKLEIMELEAARTKLLDQAKVEAANFGELLRHLVAVQVVANIRDYAGRHSDAQPANKGTGDPAMDIRVPQRPKSKPKRKTKSKAAERIGPSPVGLVVDEKAQQSSSVYQPERKHNSPTPPTPKLAYPSLTSTGPSHPPASPIPANPSLVGRQSLAEQAAAAVKTVLETQTSDGSNVHPAVNSVGDGSPTARQMSGVALQEQVNKLLEEREATRRQLDVEKAQVKAAVQDLRQRLAHATQAAAKWQALADQRGSEIARLTTERDELIMSHAMLRQQLASGDRLGETAVRATPHELTASAEAESCSALSARARPTQEFWQPPQRGQGQR